MLMPRKATPDFSLPLVGGGTFTLSNDTGERGAVICFYRGLHCPLCAKYLDELAKLTPEFEKRGVATVAVSSDGEDRARGFEAELKRLADAPKVHRVAEGKGLDHSTRRVVGAALAAPFASLGAAAALDSAQQVTGGLLLAGVLAGVVGRY